MSKSYSGCDDSTDFGMFLPKKIHGYTLMRRLGCHVNENKVYATDDPNFVIKCILNSKFNEFEKNFKELEHLNVLQYSEIYEEERYRAILMPKASEDLHILLERDNPIKEFVIIHIIRSILEGLDFLHKKNICHRDIKAENIFLFYPNDSIPLVKIADFGLAMECDFNEGTSEQPCAGTLRYAAPELLVFEDGILSFSKKGKKQRCNIDIWSLGVLFFLLVYRVFPFCSPKDQMNGIITLPNAEINNNGYRYDMINELILEMLKTDSVNRPAAHELLKHPWFEEKPIIIRESYTYLINQTGPSLLSEIQH